MRHEASLPEEVVPVDDSEGSEERPRVHPDVRRRSVLQWCAEAPPVLGLSRRGKAATGIKRHPRRRRPVRNRTG
jgi:hypothetical protein